MYCVERVRDIYVYDVLAEAIERRMWIGVD